jgi:hypothetical protein
MRNPGFVITGTNTFNILLENGDTLIAENSDNLITE